MALLEIRGLRTEFDTPDGTVRAVNGVDLDIEPGQIVGLVGESGSGKTMLGLSILRLVPPPGDIVGGSIRFKGQELLELREDEMREIRGGEIGVVFQDPMTSLNPVIPVGEQIAEAIRLHQDVGEGSGILHEIARAAIPFLRVRGASWRRAIEMLELVGIADGSRRARQYPHQFSGGMRQRVMIAMALSCRPSLLIADEPTTALDVTIQAQILDELSDLARRFGTAVLLITHDLGVVSEMCDRVAVMYAGKVFELADAEHLFEHTANPYTLALLRSLPDVDRPLARLEAIPGSVPDLIGWERGCLFAPRCPEAIAQCRVADPELVRLHASHRCRCIRREPAPWP